MAMNKSTEYFSIKSQLHGKVLDVCKARAQPGTSLIMWPYHGGDNQLWYYDETSVRIRSKLNPDLCITRAGADMWMKVENYSSSDSYQAWRPSGSTIRCDSDNKVLDVAWSDRKDGARVCSWGYHGGPNQLWQMVDYYFIIKSKMNGKVLDVEKAHTHDGASLIVWPHHGGANQLWRYDASKMSIRSKLADHLCIAQGSGSMLCVKNYDSGDGSQRWYPSGNTVRCEADGKVLDIADHNDANGARVCAWTHHGASNQLWEI